MNLPDVRALALLAFAALASAGCSEKVSPYVGTWEGEKSRVLLQRNGLGSARLFGAVTEGPLSWTQGVDGAQLSIGSDAASSRTFTARITKEGRLRVVSGGMEEVLTRREQTDGDDASPR